MRGLDIAIGKVNKELSTDYERLVALTHEAKRNGDLDGLMRYVRDVLVEDFGFDRAGVFSYDSVSETMRGVWGTDAGGELEKITNQQFAMSDSDLSLWASRQAEGRGFQLRHFEDDDERPGLPGEMAQVRDHAEIFLASAGEVVGYLSVDNLLTNRPITEEQISDIVPFAEQAAQVLLNSKLRAYREAVIDQQRRVMDLTLAITSNADQKEVFLMVRNAIMQVGSVDRVAIFVAEELMIRGTWGTDLEGKLRCENHDCFPIDPISPYFMRFEGAEDPFVIDTITVEGRGGERWEEVPHAFIPLRAGAEFIGYVAIDTLLTRRKITPAMLRSLLPITDQAAVAVQKSRILAQRETLVLQQKRLLDIAVAIVATDAMDSVFLMVRNAVLETKTVDRVGVWLIEDGVARGTWGTDNVGGLADEHGLSFSLGVEGNEFLPCLNSDIPYVIDWVHTEMSAGGELLPNTPHALIPLRAGTDLVGMLSVDTLLTMRKITPEMMELIVPLAQLAAVIVVKRRLRAAAYAEVERRREIESVLIGQTQELVAARDEALAAVRTKSQFLANMSHELRTPVNGVIGLNSLLLETGLSPQQFSYANGVQKSAEALKSMIDNILDLSKLSAGSLSLAYLPFNLRACIESVSKMMATRLVTDDVKLLSLVPDDFLAALVGDEGRLRQIVAILVDNAIKFTRKGEIRVLVTCLAESSTHATVGIEVQDSGIGIAEHLQSEVFNSFTQADGSSTRRHGGPGLGLTIAKQLVELMAGTVYLNSRLGEGTTVTVEITLAKLPIEAVLPQTTDDNPDHELHLRVLLVEDNLVNAMVALGRLEQWGCECVAVENGKEAIESIKGQQFDLALMDISMPVMDGIQATRELRRIEQTSGGHLPVIAMTAQALEGDRERCLAAGMDDYVSKPVNFEALREKLKRWGGRSGQG